MNDGIEGMKSPPHGSLKAYQVVAEKSSDLQSTAFRPSEWIDHESPETFGGDNRTAGKEDWENAEPYHGYVPKIGRKCC